MRAATCWSSNTRTPTSPRPRAKPVGGDVKRGEVKKKRARLAGVRVGKRLVRLRVFLLAVVDSWFWTGVDCDADQPSVSGLPVTARYIVSLCHIIDDGGFPCLLQPRLGGNFNFHRPDGDCLRDLVH